MSLAHHAHFFQVQLTGFSDPVYAEALVSVHQYDVTIRVTVINQTPDTLQQLSLELATNGDLKLMVCYDAGRLDSQ